MKVRQQLMATVHDVAAYILQQHGQMSTMKLQKLAYYSQAWSLVWDERPLFGERIEAWMNGPVVYDLYRAHRGRFKISDWPAGDPQSLTQDERETVDAVLTSYGKYSGQQLSALSHSEGPWRDARAGLSDTDSSSEEITPDAMQAYYSALDASEDAHDL
jgi:uncharacterized phage-associated protein